MLALATLLLLLQDTRPRATLEELLKRVPQVAASSDGGIGDAEQELAKEFESLGACAIPDLLQLLKHRKSTVRSFAGYTLGGMKGLQEEHLDDLIAAYRDGNGWVPAAIAHVGTTRAVAFLVDDLRTNPHVYSQVTGGLRSLGGKGAIALANVFADPAPVSDEFRACVCEVFGDQLQLALPAVDILLSAARRKDLPASNRRLAVESIGCVGIAARVSIPELRRLADSEPEMFSEAVEQAILGIGSPEAAEILARQLGGWDVCTLRDIAALHQNGYEAGPKVLVDLTAADPEARVAAARALGYIGYSAALDALVRETSQSDDWRLAFAAVESLGRLGSQRALPALMSVATSYWFPPVRSAAKKALAVLHGTSEYVSLFHPHNFSFEFFGYADQERFEEIEEELPRLSTGVDELTDSERKRHTYSREDRWSDSAGEHVTPRTEEPCCGLRTPNGILVGATRGEWGGEVVLLRAGLPQQTVLEENTLAIHRTSSGIIAVTGLAHLESNDGVLYRIDPAPDGSYKATWWKRLPGEPLASGFLNDGSLFVHCLGGDIVLTTEGRMQMAGAR